MITDNWTKGRNNIIHIKESKFVDYAQPEDQPRLEWQLPSLQALKMATSTDVAVFFAKKRQGMMRQG